MITYLADTTQEQRGMLRAAVEGVQVKRIGAGIYLASSISHPGEWHAVRDGRCDCEATGYCKHLAAVAMAEEGQPTPAERHAQAERDIADLFGRE